MSLQTLCYTVLSQEQRDGLPLAIKDEFDRQKKAVAIIEKWLIESTIQNLRRLKSGKYHGFYWSRRRGRENMWCRWFGVDKGPEYSVGGWGDINLSNGGEHTEDWDFTEDEWDEEKERILNIKGSHLHNFVSDYMKRFIM